MALVLDVSIAATWFLPDERSRSADLLLERVVDEGAYVPALFRWEIENVFLSAERADRISPDDVDAALDILRDLPIVLEPPGHRVFSGNELQLARHYHLSTYDAAYLALASSHRIPLATTDTALIYAARDLEVVVVPETP